MGIAREAEEEERRRAIDPPRYRHQSLNKYSVLKVLAAVLDTLLLPLFSLKHTHLYMTIHITTIHISTFSLTIRKSQRSWQATGGARGGGVSVRGRWGGGGCV
jgi:hypothetical protein